MARPIRRRPSVRVQVAQSEGSRVGLDAPAPMNVRAPSVGGIGGLLQALGVAADVYGQKIKPARDQHEFEQGMADEKLGKADAARLKRSQKYADGAYQVAILEQYHEAERKIAERAASDELDKSLPMDQQTAIVDGWMKAELGPVITDDERARKLIAERYGQFIDTFAGNVLKQQAENNAAAAEEVTMQDISAQLERTGSFNWDEQFHRLYSQTGDATRANAVLVGIVAQQMEDAAMRGEDFEKLRELIPAEVTGPNGEKLPGPMYSPKYRGIINAAIARGEDARNHAHRREFATAEYQARVKLDEDLAAGVPITMDTLAAYGYTVGPDPSDTLSPALAAQYIQASEAIRAKKQQDEAELDGALTARAMYGRWADVTGMPGGPDSVEKTQKMYDGWVQLVLTGQGASPEVLGGTGLISDRLLVESVANLSAQEGLAYGPLKRTLSSVNQAAPGDLMARMEAYQVLKAKGVAGHYVDDDAALMYEVALGAREAGEKPEGIAERVRTMGDKTTAEYVAFNMTKVNKVRKEGFDIPTGAGFLGMGDVRSTRALNAGYLATKYERLAASALSKGLSVEDAQAYAEQRIKDTHVAINIDGEWTALPRSAVSDPKTLTEALDWYVSELPALAKKLKVPEEELRVMPRFDINGRGLSFEVQRQGGVQTGVVFNAQGLMSAYRAKFPKQSSVRDTAEKRNERIQQTRTNAKPIDGPLFREAKGF